MSFKYAMTNTGYLIFFYLKCVPTSSLAKGNDPPDEFPPMFII